MNRWDGMADPDDPRWLDQGRHLTSGGADMPRVPSGCRGEAMALLLCAAATLVGVTAWLVHATAGARPALLAADDDEWRRSQ